MRKDKRKKITLRLGRFAPSLRARRKKLTPDPDPVLAFSGKGGSKGKKDKKRESSFSPVRLFPFSFYLTSSTHQIN